MERVARDATLPSPSHSPKTTTVDDDEFMPPYLPYCSMKLPASGPPLCPDMKLAMLDSNGGVCDMTFMDEFDETLFDKFNHKQLKHIAALFLQMATYKEYKMAQVLHHNALLALIALPVTCQHSESYANISVAHIDI